MGIGYLKPMQLKVETSPRDALQNACGLYSLNFLTECW